MTINMHTLKCQCWIQTHERTGLRMMQYSS